MRVALSSVMIIPTSRAVSRATATAISAGVIAGLINSILFAVARTLGLTSYSGEFLVGAIFVRDPATRYAPSAWMLGLLIQLVFSGLIGAIYAWGFRRIKKSGWDIGLAFGVVQWLFVGGLIGSASLDPEFAGQIGFYGSNLGIATFVLIFISQLLFGTIVGGLFVPVGALAARDVSPARRGKIRMPELRAHRHAIQKAKRKKSA